MSSKDRDSNQSGREKLEAAFVRLRKKYFGAAGPTAKPKRLSHREAEALRDIGLLPPTPGDFRKAGLLPPTEGELRKAGLLPKKT